jgi:ribonuclease P protein component
VTPPTQPDFSLPRSRRLSHDLEYQAVYAARMKKQRGPIIAFVAPTAQFHWRLGLAVGKRVGNAVARNTIKRALREAFRHVQHQLPLLPAELDIAPPILNPTRRATGLDIVLSAHAHPALTAAEYQTLVLELATLAHRDWLKRAQRTAQPRDEEASP